MNSGCGQNKKNLHSLCVTISVFALLFICNAFADDFVARPVEQHRYSETSTNTNNQNPPPTPFPPRNMQCGDGKCDPLCNPPENPDNCPKDCGSCGDGICNYKFENVNNCPRDCSVCGDNICSDNERINKNCPNDCPLCGDGICHSFEDKKSCPIDCSRCGDKICDSPNETLANCPIDCSICGDRICTIGENCPQDCNLCGNGTCDVNETLQNCPQDCAYCGDSTCSPNENQQNCPEDCGYPSTTTTSTTCTSTSLTTTSSTTSTSTTSSSTTTTTPCTSPQCRQTPLGCECCPTGSHYEGDKCVSDQCNAWKFTLNYQGSWIANNKLQRGGNKFQLPPVASTVSTWLEEQINQATEHCKAVGLAMPNTDPFKKHLANGSVIDDCLADYFIGDLRNLPKSPSTLLDNIWTNPPLGIQKKPRFSGTPAATTLGNMFVGGGSINGSLGPTKTIVGAIYYFDENHNSIPAPSTSISPNVLSKVCEAGSYGWVQSPISLIWKDDEDIDSEITITNFPIDPKANNRWHLWKASEKAPLLVYDPEHLGQIRSGEQLFGNWTFGGKRFASLLKTKNLDQQNLSSKWKDGFEALGSLDTNGDQEISGSELAPLGLWFDRNRNGISEEGEVKSMSEVGMLALYYSADFTEKATKNIIASLGFKRQENGKIIHGKAIDWHSDNAETKSELIGKHLAHASLCKLDQIQSLKHGDTMAQSKSNDNLGANPNKKFNSIAGIWQWTAEAQNFDHQIHTPKGFLGFNDTGTDTITGHSYSELLFTNPQNPAKSLLQITAFTGYKILTPDNQTKVIFSFDTEDRAYISNTAILSADKQHLNGISRATVEYHGKPVTVVYTWKAVRR